jgi:hypothetical protein
MPPAMVSTTNLPYVQTRYISSMWFVLVRLLFLVHLLVPTLENDRAACMRHIRTCKTSYTCLPFFFLSRYMQPAQYILFFSWVNVGKASNGYNLRPVVGWEYVPLGVYNRSPIYIYIYLGKRALAESIYPLAAFPTVSPWKEKIRCMAFTWKIGR